MDLKLAEDVYLLRVYLSKIDSRITINEKNETNYHMGYISTGKESIYDKARRLVVFLKILYFKYKDLPSENFYVNSIFIIK